MTDLSRRNFLKGLMATAGVVAAGMPALAAVEAAVAPVLPFPDHAVGDVFMKVDGIWRFLGKSVSWTVHRRRDVVLLEDLEEFNPEQFGLPRGIPDLTQEAGVDILLDDEGRQMLKESFHGAGRVDFAMSQGRNGLWILKETTIMGMWERWFGSDGPRMDSFGLLLGGVEVTFPTAEVV